MWASYLIGLHIFVLSAASLNTVLNIRVTAARNLNTAAERTTSSTGPGNFIVRRISIDCQGKNDFTSCLREKALQALTSAIKQDSIKIFNGLVLEKKISRAKESIVKTLSEARLLHNLSPIDHGLLLQADKFAQTHALKIDLSEERGEGGESKEKKKQKGDHVKYVIAALLTAMGIAGPIGLKALAAIAGKALVISKVALTIAGIIALKKLFSHDQHEETSFQLHTGDHNRRNAYVVRTVPKTEDGIHNNLADPYRYYYEYH